MDAVPPQSAVPATPDAPYVSAATDERPRGDRELELCRTASEPDWFYLGHILLADAAAVFLDTQTKNSSGRELGDEAIRYMGPLFVGLTWGFTLSGAYLSLPKCSMDFVRSAPAEGNVRLASPLALAVSLLAGATAPIFLGTIEQGGAQVAASGERSMRFILAGGMGFLGSFLPYVIPPQTWSAAGELMKLRAGSTSDAKGAFVSYTTRF